jgi:predicted amidohydrolase YtcJ
MRTIFSALLLLLACSAFKASSQETTIDLIVYNGLIYTLDSAFSTAEAMAVHKGKVLATGTSVSIMKRYKAAKNLNLEGKTVYPGLIDAHCHFYGYGMNLLRANLTSTSSFEEVIDKVVLFSKENSSPWITGRGWDQNDWEVKEFPDRSVLDSLFPDIPVLLKRVDGHAAIVNQKALDMAGINTTTTVSGGEIIIKNGRLTGVLVDNAVDLVQNLIPPPSPEQIKKALLAAQRDCFAVGLTTVDDAGLDRNVVELIRELQDSGLLKMRVYAMLNPGKENMKAFVKNGILKTPLLHVRSVKVYADGALGSRGACLLQPYSDKPDSRGFLLTELKEIKKISKSLAKYGYQMNTHCIGDSANRLLLDIYGKAQKGQNLRWRIEHAQVVHPEDFRKFMDYNVIPSVQPTHATSDMEWAGARVGPGRLQGAYAYKNLLLRSGRIALGTDFPVESINPMNTFFAAVARQNADGDPAGGFQPQHALTKEEALKGMTIWAAYANFEENEKGSLETNKLADFIILDTDIIKSPVAASLNAKVVATYVNGEAVFTAR